jgi:hypothetical protein
MSSTDVVPDPLVLAALDRAERHSNHDRGGVIVATLYDHLGVRKQTAAARRVREQVAVLVEAGSVERARRNGVATVVLTAASGAGTARGDGPRAAGVPAAPEVARGARPRGGRSRSLCAAGARGDWRGRGPARRPRGPHAAPAHVGRSARRARTVAPRAAPRRVRDVLLLRMARAGRRDARRRGRASRPDERDAMGGGLMPPSGNASRVVLRTRRSVRSSSR